MKYKKRAVIIEAEQYIVGEAVESEWMFNAIMSGEIEMLKNHLLIRTLEGQMRADEGDWIIKGVKGEIYPCKPDIFAMTYEYVDETPTPSVPGLDYYEIRRLYE